MPHLLNVWPQVSRRLRDQTQVLLLFDYDGTLTPIVEHPDAAVLAPPVKQLLARLESSNKFLARRGDRKVAFRHHGPGWPAGFDLRGQPRVGDKGAGVEFRP